MSGVSPASRRSRSRSSFQAPTEARSSGRPGRLRTTTPAVRRRSRVASGSATSQATSVLSPRGATVWPASSSRRASVAACSRPRREHLVEAVALEHLQRAERQRRGLARERRRVVAAGVGLVGRLEPARGVLEGDVAGGDRPDPLAPAGGDVEHPGAVAAAQPLLARGRVGGAVERLHVDRHGAGALRAVEDHGHVDLRQLLRRELARDPADVRADHERRGGAHRVRELAERDEPDRRRRDRARPSAARSRPGAPGRRRRSRRPARGPSRPSPRRSPRSWRSSARRPRRRAPITRA